MNKYLKLFGLLLLILFLVVYAADYIGYYDLIAHKKTVLTEEKMEEFEKDVQDAVNKFDTVEDIKNYNPKVATDEQKDAYLQLKQYADEYGLTLDQLIDKLVQLGLLQSQSKSDLLNKFAILSIMVYPMM